MKKQIIAAAVAAAFAVPAMAQVTISGSLDIGYDTTSAGNPDRTFSAGTLSTPDLKLAGSEDLGGGLKAFFDINSGLGGVLGNTGAANATAGSGQAAGEGNAINFGDRGNRVGLSGGFGTIAIGKTTGSAMNDVRGGVAGNLSLLYAGGFAVDADRPANSVDYVAPAMKLGGGNLVLRALYQTSSQSYEISGRFARGPLSLQMVYQDVKAATADRTGGDTGLRLGYNLGFAAVNVSMQDIKSGVATAGITRTDGRYTSYGVTMPMGAVSIFAESQDRPDRRGNKVNAGAVYTLSKRTNTYIAYSKDDSDAAASATSSRGAVDPITVVGVRHSF